jgi:hypothetical protein
MSKKLVWDDIQTKAKKDGELEYAFDQDRPVEKRGLIEPENGYCVGLTLRWIALRFRGKDYEYDAAKREGLKSEYQALRCQYISRETEGGVLARAEAVLRYFGIATNRGRYTKTLRAVSADILVNATFAGDGLYYVEMRGTDDKGNPHAHALAIQREGHGAVYRLFDSNEGHFVLKGTDRFKAFMDWFLNTRPYNDPSRFTPYSKEYLTGTWIVGVNAPAR